MKKLIHIICIFTSLAFSACQTESTFIEQNLIVEDQVFTLSEKSMEGTLVGKVKVSNLNNSDLRYHLVSGEYSKAFSIEDSTGALFLRDTSAISYDKVQQIDLEIMVSYSDTVTDFGVFATIQIKIINEKYSFTWISERISGLNQDAIVNSNLPLVNYGQSVYSFISAWTVDLNPSIFRSFLQFDLATVPKDAEIVSAHLILYNPHDTVNDHTQSDFSGSNAFYIRRLNADWNYQTLTWENQPSFISEGQVLLPASQSENQDYLIDVTELVKEMVKDPKSNFGFGMMLENENYYRRICFASFEYPDVNLRPQLEIKYLY